MANYGLIWAKFAKPDYNGVCVGEFLVFAQETAICLTDYLGPPTRSKPITDAIDATTFEPKGSRADWHNIGNIPFLPPTPMPNRAAIVEYLDRATADADAAIARARRQIELLEEYRTRLVADVVTGKLDVREAAAQLEAGPEEEETVDGDGFVLDN